MLWAPGEFDLARAYVTGELQTDGDVFAVLRALNDGAPPAVKTGAHLPHGVAGRRPPRGARAAPEPPAEEASPRGRRHSKSRDAQVISNHYDISNEFYCLVLGPSMTYSCARFVDKTATLEEAQESKLDLVCRKLGLHERRSLRLLDVGCGWGSVALQAASRKPL
jgi:cyclopropane-fatty-acyl-phospholipid synthase